MYRTYFQSGKCYYHPDRGAVGTCAQCGAGVCNECAVKYDGKILCRQCANEFLKQEHKEHQKNLKQRGGRFRKGTDFIVPGVIGILFNLVLFGVPYLFGYSIIDGESAALVVIGMYELFSIPFCYVALNDLFPHYYETSIFSFTEFLKFFIRVFVSCLAGWIYFPFIVIRFIVSKHRKK